MNQAIQFPDRETWDEALCAVVFPVLVNGMQLSCAIKGESLAHRYGGDTPAVWLSSFRDNRWDLEDEAEQAIRDVREDSQGWVWLS